MAYSLAGATFLGAVVSQAERMAYQATHGGAIYATEGPEGFGFYWVPPSTASANLIGAEAAEDPVIAAAHSAFPTAHNIVRVGSTSPPQVVIDGRTYEYEGGTTFTDLQLLMAHATQ